MSIKFQFLGTCAADFGALQREDFTGRFDKNARRSSAAIISERYLIDCGVHTPECLEIAGIPFGNVTDLFLTHLHGDHFQAKNVEQIAAAKEAPLRVWVSEDAVLPEMANTEVIRMPKLETMEIAEGFKVTGLYANHAENAFPQHFLFEIGEKQLLYATDGGWVVNATYNFLKAKQVDVMVTDCTCGDYEGEYRIAEHNNIPMLRVMLPSYKTVRIINDETRVYLTHLAPSLHKSHEETVEIAKGIGAEVAYDGLVIEI